jgi:hypothetical protein
MANLLNARATVAACVGVACLGLLTSSAHAQNQQSPFPILAGHFILVVPQGDIPYRIALGLPSGADSRTGRRTIVPRVVTLIAPVSDASQITRDWLDSMAFTFESQTLLLLHVDAEGVVIRQYTLRNVLPIHWSIVAGPNEKLAIETLVLYCAGGVRIEED